MTLLKRILIGGGIVLALLIALILVANNWGPGEKQAAQTMSMTAGDRTVTVSGQYRSLTQESLADGVKVVVDGHEIVLSADQLTVDGKTQVLGPDQDVDISVDDKGAVSVKLVGSDAGSPAHAAQ